MEHLLSGVANLLMVFIAFSLAAIQVEIYFCLENTLNDAVNLSRAKKTSTECQFIIFGWKIDCNNLFEKLALVSLITLDATIIIESKMESPSQTTTPYSTQSNQVNLPSNRTPKWYACIDQILDSSAEPIPFESRERFYLDLFCLKLDKNYLSKKLDELKVADLLNIYQQNLSDFIGYGIKCLKNSVETKSNVHHQMGIPQIERRDQQQDAEIIQDELEEMDEIRLPNALETLSVIFRKLIKKDGFENFSVDVIRLTAGSIENSDQVFSDFVAGIDQILADHTYSLKIRHRTLQLALSVVSGINQASINAYFLRRDLFNTIASLIANPQTISLTFDSVLLLGLLANFKRFDSRNPYLLRMEDYVDEQAMERIIALTVLALDDLKEAYMNLKTDSNQSLIGQVTTSVMNVFVGTISPRAKSAHPASHAFDSHPGRPIAILLPLYDLLRSNSIFFNLLISNQSFWQTFLSFSSFLLCHASANSRAELYGRLILVILTYFAEEEGATICGKVDFKITVNFCRQRQPPLGSKSDLARAPIASILDCVTLYLRHNLQRKLKIDCHLVCLRLVHQLLFCLQTNRVRLVEFEWRELWQALFLLGSRVGGRNNDFKDLEKIDRLAQQILDVLSFIAIWNETLFLDRSTTAAFFFEILRAEHTVKRLITVAGVGPDSVGSSAGASTIEAAKNLETVTSKTKWMVESCGLKCAEDGLETIEKRLDEIGMIDSASLESNLRKYSENERNEDLRKFINVVADDVFHLML
ncbi:hypothetical protein O181_029315 [Austropuccinia psidii MF-1]|uniref:Armadillo-like helical domain-containing protein n=1 Tax=Austropuccinia psidii MF-1 TaxID=1389203 RepID=A0A9Q3CU90_9BASI|nr:hypothetical protein [Austropuccinia psidii MF-1]